MTEPLSPVARAELALALLAIDPVGLGGLWLRGRAGPAREAFVAQIQRARPTAQRIHPGIGDAALFGGIDLSATLTAGKMVESKGVLDRKDTLILTMAERCPPGLAARLGRALDRGRHCLVALDEGAEAEESLPGGLADRLALFLDLDRLRWDQVPTYRPGDARDRLQHVETPPKALDILTQTAAALGISSLRAPMLALAVARAHAALARRDSLTDTDLRIAAELSLAHRGAVIETEDQTEPPPPEPPNDNQDGRKRDQDLSLPEDMVLDAARAALPADLLAQLATGRAARATKGASGSGAMRKGNRRGRPLPSRPGRLDGTARIDLVATLRAAAPWQTIRRQATGRDVLIELRADDIRLKRYQETSDRVLIFAVDASGSSALARLAEAKGAIELLLAQAYIRRDHVALIAFRGSTAELVLPPTRSLVQTKRRLAGLPGGGATPLAMGMKSALELAGQARARGMTPTIALLTDGRGNIALDGSADRGAAEADADRLSRAIRAAGISALVIDTGNRPQPSLDRLAKTMAAPYLPLPRADAHRLSGVIADAMEP